MWNLANYIAICAPDKLCRKVKCPSAVGSTNEYERITAGIVRVSYSANLKGSMHHLVCKIQRILNFPVPMLK